MGATGRAEGARESAHSRAHLPAAGTPSVTLLIALPVPARLAHLTLHPQAKNQLTLKKKLNNSPRTTPAN